MKRSILALFLAVVMLMSLCLPALAVNTLGVTFTAVLDKSTINVSAEDQTVTVTVDANKVITWDGIGFRAFYDAPLKLTNITNKEVTLTAGDIQIDYESGEFGDNGAGIQTADGENSTITNICVLHFTIPANTPAGTYNLGVKQIEITSDYGEIWENSAEAMTTLTITDGNNVVHTCTGIPVEGQDATCTADGWEDYYKCSDDTCGKFYTDADCTDEIEDLDAWKAGEGKLAASGHTYEEKIPDEDHLKDAATDCTEYNTYWYDCTVCDANAKDDPDAADKFWTSDVAGDHNFTEQIEDEAHYVAGTGVTCQDAKEYYYDCEDCEEMGTTTWVSQIKGDHSFTKEIEDEAHFVAGSGATCQDAKEYYHGCEYCDAIGTTTWESETMGDHDYDTTEWGYKDKDTGHAHMCQYCDEHDTVQPHTPGAEATENTDQTCTECGVVLVPALNHDHVDYLIPVEEKPATCTEDGHKAYYECACGEAYFEDENASVEIEDLDEWKAGEGKLAATDHDPAGDWESDSDNHWHICGTDGCGAIIESSKAPHADDNRDGECDTCGYNVGLPGVPTPPSGGSNLGPGEYYAPGVPPTPSVPSEPSEPSTPPAEDIPQTGDNSMMWLWIVLLIASGAGVVTTVAYGKKKSVR